jgi:biotin carboxyl carrier protein
MKKYYVTVNGNRYEVEVEEVKGDFQPSAAPAFVSQPSASAAPQPAPAQEPKPTPKSAPKGTTAGGEQIKCPMPGTIVNVNIKEGTAVKKGDLLFVLEAMKMENEIVSPVDGTVVTVEISKGQSVNTDDLLAVIQ